MRGMARTFILPCWVDVQWFDAHCRTSGKFWVGAAVAILDHLLGAGLAARSTREPAGKLSTGALLALSSIRQAGLPVSAAAGPPASSLIIQRFTAKRAGDGGGRSVIPGAIFSFVPLLLGLFAAQPVMVGTDGHSTGRSRIRSSCASRSSRARCCRRSNGSSEKGPKCIPAGAIRARASLRAANRSTSCSEASRADARAVRRGLSGARLLRRTSICRPQDDELCAGRDAIHSRMGGSCTIERFKLLIPKLRSQSQPQ